MLFRTAYDGLRPHCVVVDCSVEPSVTKQSFKDECDVNRIVSKFHRTGLIDFVNSNQPRYGDVTPIDYQEALNTVATAQEMFVQLPASLRKRFGNSPEELLAFVQNPENDAEAIKLGLKTPIPVDSAAQPQEPAPTAGGAV